MRVFPYGLRTLERVLRTQEPAGVTASEDGGESATFGDRLIA